MTIKLTDAMYRKLKSAPNFWQNLIGDSSTVDALKKRGLVDLRDRPGERGTMAGFQWRITDAGRDVDGRPEERFEVTVWDHEGNIVKKLWDASDDEVEEVREQYGDEPLKTVVVEERK